MNDKHTEGQNGASSMPKADPTKEGMRSLRDRIRETKATRWIRFGVVSVLFFLWVIWMGNPWLSIFW
ncbi:MAG: hypothetical protein K2J78_13775, partial [Muribaculaceae bacterium]|nr:hypothetical protein [Muribaculaceae bacterium]